MSDPAACFQNDFVPLVVITRSRRPESVHGGCIAITDTEGRLIASAGNPELPLYWRSAAKLHQAIALLAAGGGERYALSDSELATICSSHRGTAESVEIVAGLLQRLHVSVATLRCGAQMPLDSTAAADLICRGASGSALHNMCSGNHTGLIGLSQLLGADETRYDARENEAQRSALEIVSRFTGLPVERIELGLDGCGIPAYRTPLHALALAFARLFQPPSEANAALARAAERVTRALASRPDLISGPGELDAELLRAFGGDAVAKLGAEMVCAASFRPSARWPRGIGIAIKIADGLGARARDVALGHCLERLKLGTEAQRAALRPHIEHPIKTRRGDVAGEIVPVFELKMY